MWRHSVNPRRGLRVGGSVPIPMPTRFGGAGPAEERGEDPRAGKSRGPRDGGEKREEALGHPARELRRRVQDDFRRAAASNTTAVATNLGPAESDPTRVGRNHRERSVATPPASPSSTHTNGFATCSITRKADMIAPEAALSMA